MKSINSVCVDAGTTNCPCPLAGTGDCLVCSRLAGNDKCDCSWCGLCIYNEFMQNDGVVRNVRENIKVPIAEKRWYGNDLLLLVLKVDRSFALQAARPGALVFVNGCGKTYYDVPISIMKSDVQKGRVFLAIKVISAKTKVIAQAEDFVMLRGVYRNGLLGEGLCHEGIYSEDSSHTSEAGRWLILTKGAGLCPAINLMNNIGEKIKGDMVIDVEKITGDFVDDCLNLCETNEVDMNIMMASLAGAEAMRNGKLNVGDKVYDTADYDKIAILASDYYITTISDQLNVPDHKLIFSNNFHMCCGEGICGACSHVDRNGKINKMCKCRQKK